MAKRRRNYRLAKIHRSYTIAEIAQLFGVHRNTVRGWLKEGLLTCDDRRPTLILGRHLHDFLKAKRQKHRHACGPGQIYCVRCRLPVEPAGAMADLVPRGQATGDLQGICPHCDSMIYRRVSLARLSAVKGVIDVQLPEALQHIGDSSRLSVNSDFKQGD
ncbi:MAG: helix-turn-helix domain-containing protein [Xanthomonadales bacterium]|nr:helix-turn-helix domain-containing protein [Xanthomonadales bacterium]